MKNIFSFFLLFFFFSIGIAQEANIHLGVPLGHSRTVTHFDLSNDNKYLLSSSFDNSVKLWDVASSKPIYSIEGSLNLALFSPQNSTDKNGSKYIFVPKLGSVDVIYTLTGKSHYKIEHIKFNEFHPNGNSFMCFNDSLIGIYSTETGILEKTIKSKQKIDKVFFSAKGDTIIQYSQPRDIKLLSIKGELLNEYKLDKDSILHVSTSPDGKFILANTNKNFLIYDLKTGKLLFDVEADKVSLAFAFFSSDSKYVITRPFYESDEKSIKLWDVKTGQLYKIIHQQISWISDIVTFPKFNNETLVGSYLIVGDRSNAYLYDIAEDKKVSEFIGHSCDVYSPLLSNDYKTLYTASCDSSIRSWDSYTGMSIKTFEKNNFYSNVSFSRDFKNIISYSANENNYSITDVLKGTSSIIQSNPEDAFCEDKITYISTFENSLSNNYYIDYSKKSFNNLYDSNKSFNLLHEAKIFNHDICKDEKKLVTSSVDGISCIWDVVNKSLDYKVEHKSKCRLSKFSDDTKLIAFAYEDSTIQIEEVKTRKVITLINSDSKIISKIQFTYDNKYLVVNHLNGSVEIWDLSNNKKTNEFQNVYEGQNLGYDQFQLSPDNKYIALYGMFSNLKIYEMESGNLVNEFGLKFPYVSNITTILFHPNNQHIVVNYLDNLIKIFDFKQGEEISSLSGHSGLIQNFFISPDATILVSKANDASLIFWNLTNGEMILRHFIFSNNNWLTLHPSGLFDATPGAMEILYWVKDLEIIDFEQLKSRYWEPNLWKKVMNGETLRSVKELNKLKSAPKIELGQIGSDGKLNISLSKKDGGYGKISIYVNNKEVLADARTISPIDSTKDIQKITINLKDNPLLKIGESNKIMVKAWSEDGFVASKGAIGNYTPNGTKAIQKPTLFAIVCGISNYENDNINLRYAAYDAKSIANAINLGATELFGKENTKVYLLTSPGQKKPTKELIKNTFEAISKVAKPEDILIVYLSGHGITWGGDSGDFYYLTADSFSSNSSAYNDPLIREKTTISTKEFTEWIKKIPSLKQVMILDACGSGKAVDNLVAVKNVEDNQIKAIDRMKDRTGMFIISGCTADAVSYESSKYGQGLLTFSLLQAMKGVALKEDKYIDVNLLLNYAREQVPELAKGIGGIQSPQLLTPKDGSFDIGILYPKDREKIELLNPKPLYIRSVFINSDESEDNLSLSLFVDEYLNSESKKDEKSKIVFLDTKQFADACKISGTYRLQLNKWYFKGKVKCKESEQLIEFEAENEVDMKEKLINSISL